MWKLTLAVLIPVVAVSSFFAFLWVDFNNGNNKYENLVSSTPGASQGLQQLGSLMPSGAVIYAWWDYGRAIQEIGRRTPIVKYPSRDILNTIGYSNFLGSTEEQFFGTFESSEKIHDVARGFLSPENQSLPLMQKYGATYVMVFTGDLNGCCNDPSKFYPIAQIAGYNPTDYLAPPRSTTNPTFTPTSRAGEVTMLRLLFDKAFPPQHFTKVYDNNFTKIYQIDYPASLTSQPVHAEPSFSIGRNEAPAVPGSSELAAKVSYYSLGLDAVYGVPLATKVKECDSGKEGLDV